MTRHHGQKRLMSRYLVCMSYGGMRVDSEPVLTCLLTSALTAETGLHDEWRVVAGSG
jgi:hypothetical protein